MGSLFDLGNKEVAWSIDHKNLSMGYHIMYLNYNSRNIKEHMVNGPYHLRDLTLLSGSSDTSLSICDYAFEPYPTYAYNYTDFSSSIYRDIPPD